MEPFTSSDAITPDTIAAKDNREEADKQNRNIHNDQDPQKFLSKPFLILFLFFHIIINTIIIKNATYFSKIKCKVFLKSKLYNLKWD